MSSEVAITVESLSKHYQIYDKPRDRLFQMLYRGRRTYYRLFSALDNVTFNVKKGETVGIIGRNGSGKSTLLQLICGTLHPTQGRVQSSGRIAALLELGSGFNPDFTGRENVYMNASVLGLKEEEINDRYSDIVEFADIGDFIDQPVKTYSSGMMIRLAFAVQAQVDPDILIVDEALAVGDEKFQRKCFARLESLKSQGTSILFVSHSGPQIIELCDRALLLERGKRLMLSKPLDVVRAYQKLIYAPDSEQTDMIEYLLSSDQSSCEAEPLLSVDKGSLDIQQPVQLSADHFDEGLKPETTLVYPEQGAKIQSLTILDSTDRSVNVLTGGNEYRIILSGLAFESIDRAYFGIHIRSISGAVITGQRFPEEGRYVALSKASQEFEVVFTFQMMMLPGTYFIGGGIWSVDSDELKCCHRIMDSLMFRINPSSRSYSFGYIDVCKKDPVIRYL